jgi:hypothetical protein
LIFGGGHGPLDCGSGQKRKSRDSTWVPFTDTIFRRTANNSRWELFTIFRRSPGIIIVALNGIPIGPIESAFHSATGLENLIASMKSASTPLP